MGSLMSGWDSPVQDPKEGKYRKSWSFTKGEIESFWKLKKKIEEEHLKAISTPSDGAKVGQKEEDDGAELARSSSMPHGKVKTGIMDKGTEESLEQIMKKSDWWTRSSWAFLNEPPVLDRPSNSYASQFHIAKLSDSKADHGIAT